MELIIEIALGIVLGYAIIVKHAIIWQWAKAILITLVTCVALGFIAYFAVAAFGSAADQLWGEDWTKRVGPKVTQLAFIAVWFACLATGFSSFAALMTETVPLYREKRETRTRLFTTITTIIAVVFFVTPWLVWMVPPLDNLYSGVDRWSRDGGHADAGVMALIGIAYLWPVPILVAVKRLRGKPLFNQYPANEMES